MADDRDELALGHGQLEVADHRERTLGSTVSAGATPAPYRALDLIEGAATWSLEDGYRAEEDALADLLPGPQAQASIYAFDLVERRAKRGVGIPEAAPRRVQKLGIVGAGLMARQLALLALRRLEIPVVLRDLTQEQVDDATSWICDELDELVRKGRLGEGKARFLGSLVSGAPASTSSPVATWCSRRSSRRWT